MKNGKKLPGKVIKNVTQGRFFKSLFKRWSVKRRKKGLLFSDGFKNFYLLTLSNNPAIKNERLAFENAAQSKMWSGLGVFFVPRFKMGLVSFYTAPCLNKIGIAENDLLRLTDLLVERMHHYKEQAPWWEAFHLKAYKKVWDLLQPDEQLKITKNLNNIKLLITSAHGDLKPANVMFDHNKRIKIIDWEFYNPNGSVVLDLLRLHHKFYYNNQNLLPGKICPDVYDIKGILECGLFSRLSETLMINEEALALLSAINTASVKPFAVDYSGRTEKLSRGLKNI